MTTSAQTIGSGVVKSGWLHRQSDFLRRWKRSYCVLLNNGRFTYYTSASKKESEGMLQLQNCYAIKVGSQVQNIQPPSGFNAESLFEVKTPENNIVFCAESSDDREAWRTSMMETKQQTPNPNSGTTTYITRQYGGAPPAYNVVPGPAAAAQSYYIPAAPTAPPPYAPAPPPYAPVGQQTVTTTTTYRNNGQQRQVIVRQNTTGPVASNSSYPVQTAAYSYPGQTTYTTYGAPSAATAIPGQNPNQQPQHQTVIYQQQQPERDNSADFIAGAAVGSMAAVGSVAMMPLLLL